MDTIRKGSKGQLVKKWQEVLNLMPRPSFWKDFGGTSRSWKTAWGWPLATDGDFGEKTAAATEAWQSLHGLVADGVVGAKSWAASGATIIDVPVVRGCDLSAVQGKLSKAEILALKSMGIEFSINRLLVGNEKYVDGVAKANALAAKDVGIRVGYYFFPYPLPHLKPEEQIERFVSLLEGVGMNPGEIPPCYDMEWPPREEVKNGVLTKPWTKWGCTKEQLVEWHLRALDHGEKLTGLRWLVYSYRYHLACLEAAKYSEFAERPLWLADYFAQGRWPSASECAARNVPGPWTEIAIIQNDGNDGLRMPSGKDADFDVVPGGIEALDLLCSGAGDPDASAKVGAPKDLPAEGLDLENEIAAMRRDRFDVAA